MKILLLSTRIPYGRQSGRKTVLRTIIDSAQSLGHEVRVLAVTREPVPPAHTRVRCVRPPGPVAVGSNLLRIATGRLSLNEALYDTRSVRRAVRLECENWSPDVLVADMLRTAPVALATGRPVIVDLDDLLSNRYEQLRRSGSRSTNFLGYYGEHLPAVLRPALGALALRALGLEHRLVRRRELAVARAAAVVSLVSEDEAARFAREAGRPVAWLPMAVPVPHEGADVRGSDPDRLVFVGGLDYSPNVEALDRFVRDVLPAMTASGLCSARLRVVGHCPPRVRDRYEGVPQVELLGYVDDLAAELADARAFVAPIPSGTGVKTKVLEAMAAGVPVVTTEDGAQGIGARDQEHLLLASSGEEFAAAISRLVDGAEEAAKIGAAGRELVASRFAHAVVRERWRLALDEAAPPGHT